MPATELPDNNTSGTEEVLGTMPNDFLKVDALEKNNILHYKLLQLPEKSDTEINIKTATGITSPIALEVQAGTIQKIELEACPFTSNLPQLFWESGDPEVVSVDETGTFFAVGLGSTTITAHTIDSDLGPIVIEMEVVSEIVPLTLDPDTMEMTLSSSSEVTSTITSSEEAVWVSSDEDVVTVTSPDSHNTSTVTAVGEGIAIITATTTTGKTATCKVTILSESIDE